MSRSAGADTIRILVSTDNHVGYNERDPIRGNDSWQTFDEIMQLAKDRDVDMVLLAGDLFHENKPSRQAMYQVMRSLRENCYGDKPCELQIRSDESEHFAGTFNHVNWRDQDINVAIPVFSIHGNHDDPSGEGHLAALDILAMSGLLNYYGRTPEADNIEIKPLLLEKGTTKLGLFGMSNVRDERLFRTFRDHKVKWYRPSNTDEWFNILSVHQNHNAHGPSNYLPEEFLPTYMDLVVWGHEHECKIEPETNPIQGFKVMQPGSSVATSLCAGEAVPKKIAILSITGTELETEIIRLKTVRPFIMREIVLKDELPEDLAFAHDNKSRITQFLTKIVHEMIKEGHEEWRSAQEEDGGVVDEDEQPPAPLIRLRIECSAPEGGKYDFENPQRFSQRFAEHVANTTDIVQFHRKKSSMRKAKMLQPDDPEEAVMAQITIDSVKIDELVREFLSAQSLTILPQNLFSDAVSQYVDKDDRNAMEEFLKDSLKVQMKDLLTQGKDERELDDDLIAEAIETTRLRREEAFARGELKRMANKKSLRPKPAEWDSEDDGHWEDQPMAFVVAEDGQINGNDDDDAASVGAGSRPARGRGSRGGARGAKTAPGTTRKTASATTKKAPAKTTGRGKKKPDADDEDDGDVIMIDDDEEDESQGLFVSQATSRSRTQRSESPAKKPAPKSTRGRGGGAATNGVGRQTQLSFVGSQVNGVTHGNGASRVAAAAAARRLQPSEDEISDDDDAFEPPPPAQRNARARRR